MRCGKHSDGGFYVVRAVLLNACYWIVFWTLFACAAHPCIQGADIDECCIFGRTFSGDMPDVEKLIVLPMIVQVPSILVSEAIILQTFRSLKLSPTSHFGNTSQAGWILLLTTILSGFQWAAIGWLTGRFWQSRPQGARKQSA